MIKEKFKELVNYGIQPSLKEAGFKKSGNHFIKKMNDTQQIVTLQLSQGNSHQQLRFYFRCGVLVNKMKPEQRDLKSEVYADYRFDLSNIANNLEENLFEIREETKIEEITIRFKEAIQSKLIPFFSKLETTEECIAFMASQDSLQGCFELINYLCLNNQITQLQEYIIRLSKFLNSIKDTYNDPNTARRFIERMMLLISEHGKMTDELKVEIEKKWQNT